MESFQTHLYNQMADGKLSDYTANEILKVSRQFVEWLIDHERIDPVRNLRKMTIQVSPKEPTPVPLADVKRLLEGGTDRTRLYTLLAINCGYLDTDIGTLLKSEVNWTEGRISRKRHKTRHNTTNTPKVDYKLWGETFGLLTAQCAKDGELVLLNERGKPLTRQFIDDEGNVQDIRNIKTTMKRLRKKLGVSATFAQLRKTSVSMLEGHDVFCRYSQYFLGHAPRTTAEKHYIQPSKDQFDKAIDWLAGQYGLK